LFASEKLSKNYEMYFINTKVSVKNFHKNYMNLEYTYRGPKLTIFAITRFLIIENILRLAGKRHTYRDISPIILFIINWVSRQEAIKWN
jgi:hypothetical protein